MRLTASTAPTSHPAPIFQTGRSGGWWRWSMPRSGNARLDLLTEAGFRRSQGFLYKPVCPGCRACVPVRIAVDAFRPGRSFRRVLNRNADLRWQELRAVTSDEQFELFHRYLRHRHRDGGMIRMDRQAYADMVEVAPASTRVVEFRGAAGRPGRRQPDRLSARACRVSTSSSRPRRRRARSAPSSFSGTSSARVRWACRSVYLGYWIADSRKMAYKARFAPLEQLDGRPGSRWPDAPPMPPGS